MGASEQSEGIRPPAHAGTFYPGDPGALTRLVDAQLASSSSGPGGGWRRGGEPPAGPASADAGQAEVATPARPVGLVVPHAGLQYSGPVAAAAWGTLRARPPATVVVAGTNHYVGGLDGVAAWPAGAWGTPIGVVPVDAGLVEAILGLGAPFVAAPRTHRREHSIEVQLPFLVRACPGTAIVPLLVSFGDADACLEAGSRLGGLLRDLRAAGRDVVLAASTDFAHYPAAEHATAVTEALLPALVAKDGARLVRRETELRFAGIAGLACGMCGIEPASFSLAAFAEMELAEGVVIATATSADAPGGDPFRTVGYAAIAYPPVAAGTPG